MPEKDIAARLRGFGPVGIIAFLILLLAGPPWFRALLVILWMVLSRTPPRKLGLIPPRSWARTVAVGILFGVAFKLVMKAIVMPLLSADPINHAYHFLVGNHAALPGMLLLVVVSAGIGEEVTFRGYLFERLRKLFGRGRVSMIAIVLVTAAWFGIVHYADQGWSAVEQAFIVGLVFGAIFAVTWRLPMLMVAHAAFDITAIAIIYFDLELRVAHLIFA
ncbi:MAG: CPBP family intramembrane glutamic endopeptidase [Chthoniobacterales bacterium]